MGHPVTTTEYWQTYHIHLMISVKLLVPKFQKDKNTNSTLLSKFQDVEKNKMLPKYA